MNFKSLTVAILTGFIYLLSVSFQSANSLQGTWEYNGGKYNRQVVTSSPVLKLRKVYTASGYQVLEIYPNGKTVKNEEGTYTIKNYIYEETQNYSNAHSSLKSKIMQYTYTIKNNVLTIKGKLTNKWPVEEYWKKVQ